MAVITISRQFGSGGDEIANRLCEVLGYWEFDKRLIAQAAEDAGISRRTAIDYSEDNHQVIGFIDRLMGRSATPCQRIAWTDDPTIASRPERADIEDSAVLWLVKRAIEAAYKQGNIVIVGRGGQVVLKDAPGVLHVRVDAPLEERIQRVKVQMKLDKGDFRADIEVRRAAQDLIRTRDAASADYLKRHYGVDWDNPLLYHLALNTGRLPIDLCVLAIVETVRRMEKVTA